MEKITLKNFQKHKHLEIGLSPIVTIVGPTDSGKSAIIRAFYWVTHNQPKGTAIIKHGSKVAEVSLEVNGNIIERSRSLSENTYKLNGEEFKAFGADVPPQITKVLNISDLNYQHQHDRTFWLSETAGEVSRQLNEIVDLSIIDTTLSNIASKLRAEKSKESVLCERVNTAKDKRAELRPIREQDEELKHLEEMDKVLFDLFSNEIELTKQIKTIKEQETILTKFKMKANEGKVIVQKGNYLGQVNKEFDGLKSLLDSIGKYQKAAKQVAPDISGLETLADKLEVLETEKDSLENMVKNYGLVKSNYDNKLSILEKLKKQFKEQMGDTCILCGQKIKSQ